jgi:hypothetical protein
MRRVDFKAIWGAVLIVAAAGIASFAMYGLVTLPLGAHGGPYMLMGGLLFIGIAVLLAVVGGRLIRSSRRAALRSR